MKTQDLIRQFLGLKRFAFIGVSRQANEFSRGLFREMLKQGYDVIPVNPHVPEMDGKRCYERIQDIQPPVTAAFVLVPSYMVDRVLIDCKVAGVSLVWMHGISGEKDLKPSCMRYCEEQGISLVPGYCPYMFFPTASLFHRFHGFVWKAVGLYPR